jgi:transposase
MRGDDERQEPMWSYVSAEDRIPADHPLRAIRKLTDPVLRELSPLFESLYSRVGRPSIAPERLLRALLLQLLYTIRSERLLMEQLDYNILFRWFVGLSMDDTVWAPTVFTKNRDRLLEGDVAEAFFEKVLELARERKLLSDEHFTVDGTLIEAWAGHKSFKKKDEKKPKKPSDPGNPSVDFRGEKRTNDTHASTTDPESRLYRKSNGEASRLCFVGHVLMENRSGLAVNSRVTEATGRAEHEAGVEMAADIPGSGRVTIGGDKNYDCRSFVEGTRKLGATPHVAKKISHGAIDGRTVRHEGYLISQRKRKRVEEIFGWLKTIGLMRKTRHRGKRRVGWMFTFTLAAFNLVRIKNIDLAMA